MPENVNELYSKINFIINGGAVKLLTDFLEVSRTEAIVAEPDGHGRLNVIGASLTVPSTLTINDDVTQLFPKTAVKEAFEIEGRENVIRIRGTGWEVYVIFTKVPEGFTKTLEPYAELIKLWKTSENINDIEKKLSRLSYMILATKNTLASIFEPMPLQYFASFLADVLQESLFPNSIAILKDEGTYLTVFNGKADSIPERKGIYAEQILPPTPVFVGNNSVVLPVCEGDCRLFCLMEWDEKPDDQTMNFLELLGNLAVRAIAINNLRVQSMQVEANISAGEFTVLSLSNVLKVLKTAEDKERFFSLLVDVFMEQCRMKNCILASWNKARNGYTISQQRRGHIKAEVDPTLLPSPEPVSSRSISEPHYDLSTKTPDQVFRSWGLAGCPSMWKNVFKDASVRYIFPVCDDSSLVGIIALGENVLNRSQLASLQLIAQFAAYEFKRFA